MRGSECAPSVVTRGSMYTLQLYEQIVAPAASAQACTGVLHELAGNVPVIPGQVFDVGRGRIEEFWEGWVGRGVQI